VARLHHRSRTFWTDVRYRRGVRERLIVAGMLVAALGTAIFFYFGHAVLEGNTRDFDEWAVRALRNRDDQAFGRGPAWLNGAVRDVTAFGSVTVVSMVSLAALGFAILRGKRRLAVLILAAGTGALLLNDTLKSLYDRPRPQVPNLRIASPSFPSGHAMASAAVYLSLAAVLAVREPQRRMRVYMLGLGFTLTLLVGLSRVYLGAHYPSDVLAGWLVGVVWAVLCGLASVAISGPPGDRPATAEADR
jgi:undecaprenyl-diphosphatase